MDKLEHLKERKWEHPDSYFGHSPDGDYVIYSRNRDSRILDNSNYELILADLEKISKQYETDDEPFVYDFRASHWACGWIETIIVKKDSPVPVLEKAADIICALADYPVYDEGDYCEREHEAACQFWQDMSIKERYELCKEYGENIFAARHDYMPIENDGIYEYLRCDL